MVNTNNHKMYNKPFKTEKEALKRIESIGTLRTRTGKIIKNCVQIKEGYEGVIALKLSKYPNLFNNKITVVDRLGKLRENKGNWRMIK